MRAQGMLFLPISLLAIGAGACSKPSSITDGNSPAGDYSFCGALTATCNSFYGGPAIADEYFTGLPASCTQAAPTQCPALQHNFSAAFQNAVVACAKTSSPCDGYFNNCVGVQTARTPPTPAQAKVRADFCEMYSDGTDGGSSVTDQLCSSFFQVTDQGDGGSSSIDEFTYGPGFIVLMVNDNVATQMDQCIAETVAPPSADAGAASTCGSCLENLQACARAAFRAAVIPAGCVSDGG